MNYYTNNDKILITTIIIILIIIKLASPDANPNKENSRAWMLNNNNTIGIACLVV